MGIDLSAYDFRADIAMHQMSLSEGTEISGIVTSSGEVVPVPLTDEGQDELRRRLSAGESLWVQYKRVGVSFMPLWGRKGGGPESRDRGA